MVRCTVEDMCEAAQPGSQMLSNTAMELWHFSDCVDCGSRPVPQEAQAEAERKAVGRGALADSADPKKIDGTDVSKALKELEDLCQCMSAYPPVHLS